MRFSSVACFSRRSGCFGCTKNDTGTLGRRASFSPGCFFRSRVSAMNRSSCRRCRRSHERGGVGHFHAHEQLRVALRHQRQRHAPERAGREGAEPHGEAADGQALELQHVALDLLRIGEELAGAREHQFAGLREAHGAVGPVDQARLQVVFERVDAARERGLRQVHGLRGAAEAALLGKGDEVLELAQLHFAFSVKRIGTFCICQCFARFGKSRLVPAPPKTKRHR
jgi:hypothetical protein